MTERISSCLEKYSQVYKNIPSNPKLSGSELTVGEAYPVDDYQSSGFSGYNNPCRSTPEIELWASETRELARKSILAHVLEVPFKLFSYFTSHPQGEHSWLCKVSFAVERLIDTLGGRFRNKIYAHEDREQKLDDNLGAEKFARDKFGDSTTYQIATANNYFQTIGRFLIPLVGLLNPTLANDLDWVVGGALDSIRWKRAASNSAFYPGLLHDLTLATYTKCKNLLQNKKDTETIEINTVLSFMMSQLKKHFTDAKAAWHTYSDSASADPKERKESLTNLYKHLDQITSAFLSFSQWPNMVGDILRPMARRLDLSGISRNFIRTLSVIDRPFIWINYLFRFYLPERIAEKEKNDHNLPRLSLAFPIAVGGDILDFASTLFQDTVKESPKWIQHSLNIAGIIKSTALKIFFSGRRERIANEALRQTRRR